MSGRGRPDADAERDARRVAVIAGAASRGERRRPWLHVVDQGVSSLTNMVAALTAAALLGSTAFAAYALCITVYRICLGLAAAVGPEVSLTTRAADVGMRRPRSPVVAATGLIVGATCGAVILSVSAIALSGELLHALLALSLLLPLTLLADCTRLVLLYSDRAVAALVLDATWLLISGILLAVLSRADSPPAWSVVVAWAAGGALAVLTTGVGRLAFVALGSCAAWMRQQVRTSVRFLAEYGVEQGAFQGGLILLLPILGPEDYGDLRLAQILLGGITILHGAAFSNSASHFGRMSGRLALQRTMVTTLALLGTSLAAVVVAIVVQRGTGVIRADLFVAIIGWSVTQASWSGHPAARAVHRLGAAGSASTRIRTIHSMLLLAAVASASAAGLLGYLVGTSVAGFTASVLYLTSARSILIGSKSTWNRDDGFRSPSRR